MGSLHEQPLCLHCKYKFIFNIFCISSKYIYEQLTYSEKTLVSLLSSVTTCTVTVTWQCLHLVFLPIRKMIHFADTNLSGVFKLKTRKFWSKEFFGKSINILRMTPTASYPLSVTHLIMEHKKQQILAYSTNVLHISWVT